MIQLQNGRSLNLPYIEAFKLLKVSDWNVENRQNVILSNVDYLCKGIKDKVLRGNILEVVLNLAPYLKICITKIKNCISLKRVFLLCLNNHFIILLNINTFYAFVLQKIKT